MIRKEDFKFGFPEKYSSSEWHRQYYKADEYTYDTDEYLLIIPARLFDDEMIEYANKIVNLYKTKKKEIIDYVVDSEDGANNWYDGAYGWDREYLKNNLGKPWITINFRKTIENFVAELNYGGQIEYVESNLDEHIVSVNFGDDLVLYGSVNFDG